MGTGKMSFCRGLWSYQSSNVSISTFSLGHSEAGGPIFSVPISMHQRCKSSLPKSPHMPPAQILPPRYIHLRNEVSVIEHFLNAFEELRIHPLNDKYKESGIVLLKEKLQYFIRRKLPIQIVLPAFPFKSPNTRTKVLGNLPDRAEELALERLQSFCLHMEKVYTYGIRIVIFSDGRVFNDLLGVSTDTMLDYNNALKKIVKRLSFTQIQFDCLENYFSQNDAIQRLVDRYNISKPESDEMIREDPCLLKTYLGFTRFLLNDLQHQLADKSNTKKKQLCSDIAKKMIHRNSAFSKLVDAQYPNHIRWSIHAHDNSGHKLGIHLLPPIDDSKPITPWHCVIVEDAKGNHIEAKHLRDVILNGGQLKYRSKQKWSFIKT